MKITKTPFKTEIDIQPDELRRFYEMGPGFMVSGLLIWIKKMFGLDMWPKKRIDS